MHYSGGWKGQLGSAPEAVLLILSTAWNREQVSRFINDNDLIVSEEYLPVVDGDYHFSG